MRLPARATPEVDQLHDRILAALRLADEDVLRLEIAMDHARLVGVVQAVADLQGDVQRLFGAEPPVLVDRGRERATPQQLHHAEGPSVGGLAVVADVDHVGVLDAGDDLRLAKEASDDLVVVAQLVANDLGSQRLADHRVGDAVDQRHTALPDQLIDPVAAIEDIADARPSVGRRCGGRHVRQRRPVHGAETLRDGVGPAALTAHQHRGAQRSRTSRGPPTFTESMRERRGPAVERCRRLPPPP